MQITGKATKPLASATSALKAAARFPPNSADDGCVHVGFAAPSSSIEKSGAYWFDLTDREGLHGGSDDRWEILAVPDAPPAVHIEKPNADLFVTPQAVVPIRVSAKDDLALRDVALVFRLAESKPEQSLPLFSGPRQPPQQSGPNRRGR